MKSFGVCLIQNDLKGTKEETVLHAVSLIRKAVEEFQPKIVALPECFYCPYDLLEFPNVAEHIPDGYTSQALSSLAKELNVHIIGGSIIEIEKTDENILYNTCTVWDPNGQLVAKHRKVHLCDLSMEDFMDLNEASVLTPGDAATTFEVDGVQIGLMICYDTSFVEFFKVYQNLGCSMIFSPSVFDVVTGEMHWNLIHRARALDNQIYMAAISPARNYQLNYVPYGGSMVIDPYARIIAQAGEKEEIVHIDIDLDELQKMRNGLPLHRSRRPDVYYKKEPEYHDSVTSHSERVAEDKQVIE